MSDEESLREDGRIEEADERARRHVCHLVNSATPEPPECAACEIEAEEADAYVPTFKDLGGREHLLSQVCWCQPTCDGTVLRHRDTLTTKI